MIQFTPDVAEATKGGYDPIPEGTYELHCTACVEKPAKNDGSYLKADFVVIGPTHAGRKIFARITLKNNGPKGPAAVAIGTRQLHAWALLAKLPKIEHAADFVGSTIVSKVTVKKKPAHTDPGTGKTYDESLENEISFSFKPGAANPATTTAANNGVDKAPDKW